MWTLRAAAPLHNSAVVANTDFLAADITPGGTPSMLRVMVSISSAEEFRAVITREASAQTVAFNSGVNLVADALYMFEMIVDNGDTINFQVDGNTTIIVFRVHEIVGQ